MAIDDADDVVAAISTTGAPDWGVLSTNLSRGSLNVSMSGWERQHCEHPSLGNVRITRSDPRTTQVVPIYRGQHTAIVSHRQFDIRLMQAQQLIILRFRQTGLLCLFGNQSFVIDPEIETDLRPG